MKHIIIIKGYTLNLWIKGCPHCKERMTIMLGNKSRLCLDCLNSRPYPQKHIPSIIIHYTNKLLIKHIRMDKINELRVKRESKKVVWEKIVK